MNLYDMAHRDTRAADDAEKAFSCGGLRCANPPYEFCPIPAFWGEAVINAMHPVRCAARHPLRGPIPASPGPSDYAPGRDRGGRSSAFRRKVRPRSGMQAPLRTSAFVASSSRSDPGFAGSLGLRSGAPLEY